VLSDIGRAGYKSSLRHDRFVPDIALVDPELTLSCPPDVTAACGMDALTQLLESYVSTKASPMTDALALSGLEHVAAGLLPSVENGAHDIEARSHMAYGALLSGVTLANAGLGVVHGYAGPLGGYHPIPHGVVCGTLIGEATRVTIEELFKDAEKNRIALRKYAKAGSILARQHPVSVEHDCDLLVRTLNDWIARTGIPRLGHFGLRAADLPAILDKSNGKNSPATLSRAQMAAILEAACELVAGVHRAWGVHRVLRRHARYWRRAGDGAHADDAVRGAGSLSARRSAAHRTRHLGGGHRFYLALKPACASSAPSGDLEGRRPDHAGDSFGYAARHPVCVEHQRATAGDLLYVFRLFCCVADGF